MVKVNELPDKEYVLKGNSSCSGCGAILISRLASKILGENQIMTIPASCMGAVAGRFPTSSYNLPLLRTAFAPTGAFLSGLDAAIKVKGEDAIPVAIAGDGGTADIGIQALSGAVERGHNFIYICYDNEAYMNTGFQRSGATPLGARTSTTPGGSKRMYKAERKKDIAKIMAAHDMPYVATAVPSYPDDLTDKVQKAADIEGPAFLHVLSPCPLGWGYSADQSVQLGRLAVETGQWKLYDVENGAPNLTVKPKERKPVKEYFEPQGRFDHLTDEDYKRRQEEVDEEWDKIESEGFSLCLE